MTVMVELPPDQDQRELIRSELGRSMLVEAAAGTGKTASMVGRMVELLRTGACIDIRSIAAVTFTRKAAAELRARFRLELERAARQAQGEERERLKAGLNSFEQCFIGTIHSFCARLLRERPVEAGVDLSFEEIDDEADELLRGESWREYCATLFTADPHGTLAELERVGLDPLQLEDAFKVFTMYPDADRWPVPECDLDPDVVVEVAGEVLDYVAHMSAMAAELPRSCGRDELIPRYRSLPRIAAHYDLDDPRRLAELLETWFDRPAGVVQYQWEQDGRFTREDAKREQARWEDFRDRVAVPFLRRWRQCRYPVVITALSEARELYDAKRAERGKLNFQDLLMKAARLLRDNPHVRRYFSSRYTHLLVDEFQDTDPVQAEVMLLLTATDPAERRWRSCRPRPGSLFVVGDPKQSIFRFRRADIVTYEEVKRIILSPEGTEAGVLVRLSTNFRTLPPLVDWVNSVFRPENVEDDGRPLRFPSEATPEMPCYVDLVPGRPPAPAGTLSGVFMLEVPEAVGNKEQAVPFEADLIGRFIRSSLDTPGAVAPSPRRVTGGADERLQPSDFLIVTRYKSNLSGYAAALERYGIPHQVTGGTALNEVEELSLLRVTLRAVTRADDPVALVSALRSEAFGVSDRALYRFRSAGGSFDYNQPLPGGLTSEDRQVFTDSFARLKRYRGWLSTLPAPSALARIAADLGLFALAGSREGGEVQAGSLARALELMRAVYRDEWSVARLVEYLGELVDRRQGYDGIPALSTDRSSVRVMNLHKAKGLEAPLVFLADAYGEGLHQVQVHIDRTGDEVRGYMAVTAGRNRRLLAHPEGWESLGEREAAFSAAEELRLRYVAATRAGCALYITERTARKQNSRNAWRHFLPLIPAGAVLSDPGPCVAPVVEPREMVPGEAQAASLEIRNRLADILVPTYDLQRAKELSLGGAPAEGRACADAGPCHTLETPPSRHGVEWGELIHRLFEVAARSPGADLEVWARSLVAEDELEPEWVEPAVEAVRRVVESSIWKRAARASARLAEVPFCVRLDEEGCPVPRLVRGAIDLAFREPDGWVLVDYKTDRVDSPGDLRRLVARYAPQLDSYARAWLLCTGEEVRETGFFFTSSGEYVKVRGGEAG